MSAPAISAIDDRLQAFERAAAATRQVPEFDPFLPPSGDPDRAEAVRELACVALELRWARGERPSLADYLSRYPELEDPEARAAVAYEDYRQRILAGERPSRDSYQSQFGVDVSDWPGPEAAATSRRGATSVESSRDALIGPDARELRTVRVGAQRPDDQPLGLRPGDHFLGFKLVRELGRGAFARVFLAEQADLADRPVALKVSALLAGEVRTLARLQHTNIAPVHSVHRTGRFQAVCMPYFGGTTLSATLSESGPCGRAIANAVRSQGERSPATTPTLTFLESASHVDVVLWIGERLADALAHAHDRGIIHRDIKPANVLIADDGQPMLLDFNLAQDDNEPDRARAGGTFPYMAPEQMAAFGGEPRKVDGRADVYALGVLLFQLLARRRPFPDHAGSTVVVLKQMLEDRGGPPPRLPLSADVTPAVESIVRKCLEPDVARRYQSAADLREDISRHRANLELRHASERSLRERARKWIRRNPRFVSPGAIAAYAAAILLAVSAIIVQLSLSARAHRQDAERLAALQKFDDFLSQADQVKLYAGSPAGSADVLRLGTAALDQYRATEPDWERQDNVARLPSAERDRLKSEVGEIAFLTARAAAQRRRDADLAARLNTVAAESLGPDAKPAVAAQRSELTGLTPAEISAAVSDGGRGDLLRAHDLAARGRFREALPLAARFVARNPDDFGGWFLKARCHDILGQYADAWSAYSTCAALRPRSVRPIAARGELALRHGKDLEQARVDFDRALQLDPHFTDARLNRALHRRRAGLYAEALADLDLLAADPKAPTRIYFVRAQVKEAAGDKAGAAADRAEGMKREPTDAVSFVSRGLARATNDPEGALADFVAAEKLDPFYPESMVNQAWLLGEKMNRPAEALAAADRLLALYPDHHTVSGGRAVLLARMGRAEEAVAAIRRYLVDAAHPATYYHAACVYAIVSKSEPKYRAEAVRLTAVALLRGFGHDFLLTDEDLNPIRDDEQFRKLYDGVKVMKDLGGKK